MTPGTLACADLPQNTDTLLWTADELAVIAVLLTNCTANDAKVRVHIVKSGEALARKHAIEFDSLLEANQPLERSNRIVGSGDKIYARADIEGVVVRIDGIRAT